MRFNLKVVLSVLVTLGQSLQLPNTPIGLLRLRTASQELEPPGRDRVQISFSKPRFQEHFIHVPVDHFQRTACYEPHSNDTFPLRYYYDDTYYIDGGPVFILDGGETSVKDRLPYLETGILNILSRATNGIGIILEHRYYGKSHVTPNLTTDSLRFLTTEQSLADNAYFAQHVQLPRLGRLDPSTTPVIIYGGSYAGGKAAFSRLLYPDIFYGAIASSGVVHAQLNSWQYFEPIRQHGPPRCISALEAAVTHMDQAAKNATALADLQQAFGLSDLTHADDFFNVLSLPLSGWQERTWDTDPSPTNPFYHFCDALAPKDASYQIEAVVGRYASYVKSHLATACPYDDQDLCFGTHNAELYKGDGLEETWKLWTWQYCTEWGYFIGAAPDAHPTLVSRHLDLKYNERICQLAFPDGDHVQVPKQPAISRINDYGDFRLNISRLAVVDGDEDPWLFATLHAPAAQSGKRRDSASQPFKLIKGGVCVGLLVKLQLMDPLNRHHWDEYGSPLGDPLEPDEIIKIHGEEVAFVLSWLADFRPATRSR